MRQRRGRRVVLWGVFIGLGGSMLSGGIAARAGTGRASTTPGMMAGMAGMAGMRATRPAATMPAPGSGTVVALHRRLVRVTILNFAFQPARLVVSAGTRIVWTNRDSDPHTVTGTTGHWASDALDTDAHFARVFRAPGTFAYYCSIHPYMHGAVVVKK